MTGRLAVDVQDPHLEIITLLFASRHEISQLSAKLLRDCTAVPSCLVPNPSKTPTLVKGRSFHWSGVRVERGCGLPQGQGVGVWIRTSKLNLQIVGISLCDTTLRAEAQGLKPSRHHMAGQRDKGAQMGNIENQQSTCIKDGRG